MSSSLAVWLLDCWSPTPKSLTASRIINWITSSVLCHSYFRSRTFTWVHACTTVWCSRKNRRTKEDLLDNLTSSKNAEDKIHFFAIHPRTHVYILMHNAELRVLTMLNVKHLCEVNIFHHYTWYNVNNFHYHLRGANEPRQDIMDVPSCYNPTIFIFPIRSVTIMAGTGAHHAFVVQTFIKDWESVIVT